MVLLELCPLLVLPGNVAALAKRIDLSSDADGPSLVSFRILTGIA